MTDTTTEAIEMLHDHLDAQPDDHLARLALADELDAIGSPLTNGYRALALLKVQPHPNGADPEHYKPTADDSMFAYSSGLSYYQSKFFERSVLPRDWFYIAAPAENVFWTRDCDTRREAEDAAAMAFTKLPAERQQELLAGNSG